MIPRAWQTSRWTAVLAALFVSLAVATSSLPAQSQPAAGNASHSENIEKKPLRKSGNVTTPSPAGPTSRPSTQKAAVAAKSSGTFDVQRLVTALAIVLLLILLLRWVAKRVFGVAGAGRSTRAVQVLSRSPLSPKQQLVLLRVGRRLLVVADGGGQMNTLSEITDPDEVAMLIGQVQDDHAGRASKSFGSLFGKMRTPYDEQQDQSAGMSSESEAAFAVNSADVEVRRNDGAPEDPAVTSTRQELSGLMDKVRMISRQFKSP